MKIELRDPLDSARGSWAEDRLGDPSHFFAMSALLRLARRVMLSVDKTLRNHGLTLNAYLLLMTLELSPKGSRILTHLAEDLMVHPTTVTLTVDKMELNGLVTKSAHETDRRAVRTLITSKGRALAREITLELNQQNFGLGQLSGTQIDRLVSSMKSARRAVGDITS